MTMMREPSMIMLIFLSAALATPAVAQTGKSKAWIKVKNLKAPAATPAIDGTF